MGEVYHTSESLPTFRLQGGPVNRQDVPVLATVGLFTPPSTGRMTRCRTAHLADAGGAFWAYNHL
jgi:hypothetical protein